MLPLLNQELGTRSRFARALLTHIYVEADMFPAFMFAHVLPCSAFRPFVQNSTVLFVTGTYRYIPVWVHPACCHTCNTRSVQCLAAVARIACSLAHPACLRKALRTLLVYTTNTVVFPFRTRIVMRSVWSSHCLLSLEISRPSSARVSTRSLMGSP
jgi:hypothetical protein